jgi:hypothetical protein
MSGWSQGQILRGLELLLSMTLVAGAAFGQADEHPDPRQCAPGLERLHASSLQEKAWGAHLIAQCHANDGAAEIAAELDRLQPDMSGMMYVDLSGYRHLDYAWWAAKALLDALIQLHRPLEVPKLYAIFQRFPTEGTILMLQDEPRYSSLLARVREARVPISLWVAASNALTRLRPHGFATALLEELRLSNRVWVSDTDKFLSPGSPGSGMLGNSSLQVPPGFPPIDQYWLTAEHFCAEQTFGLGPCNDELVSEGPAQSIRALSVYSRRVHFEPGVNRTVFFPSDGYCRECEAGCPQCESDRICYLAELAHMPSRDISTAANSQEQVAWANPARISATAAKGLTEQVAAMRRLARHLVSSGAMDVSELDLTLYIEVRLWDFRGDRTTPLPQLQPVRFNLQ